MNTYRNLTSFVSVLLMALSSLVIADDSSKDNISGYKEITEMAEAIGGLTKILNLESIKFNATGSRFEPEQAFKPGGTFNHVGDYQYTQTRSLTKQQSRTEFANSIFYIFPGVREYTAIVNGEHGALIGNALIGGPPEMPMSSTRLAAHVKQYSVSSILSVIQHASHFSEQVKYTGTAEYNGRDQSIISIPGWEQDIHVFIDRDTHLPSKITTLEDDSVYGDTLWEIALSDWVDVNGIKLPSTLLHTLNDRLINVEHRSSYDLNNIIDSQLYSIPTELVTDFNTEQFAWGIRSSQWFNRFLPVGVQFDLDQRTSTTMKITEIAPKVFHATALTHNSMIIEMDDYLIVAEAPLYKELSQVVINEIKTRWPDKPVKFLIVSHFHNDHIGGIRAYGAIGATLIVGSQTKDHYEAIFKASHSLYPDSYEQRPVDVTIVEVESNDDFIIDDGKRKIRIFDVANSHATGSLVPFVEDVNLVFTSDLYSPGFFPATIPEPFLSWSSDLLFALEESGLNIATIVGGHGGFGSYKSFVSQVESSQ